VTSSFTTAELRQTNLSRALQAVQRAGSMTRAELTRELGISRNTSAQIVGDLVDLGLLVETAAGPSGRRGRPTTELRLGPELPAAVVAEITPEDVRIATVRLGRAIEDSDSAPLGEQDPGQVLAWVARQAGGRIAMLGGACQGVAVSVYGLVDSEGVVQNAPNLSWHGVAVGDSLRRALPEGTPVYVGNDASMAALHEARYGAGVDVGVMLYLYSADGVGGGLVVDGRLLEGRQGYAGEVGHMMVNPIGAFCRCGRRGCWETEVDQRALRHRGHAPPALGDLEAAESILAASQAGSADALAAVEETARWFGEGLGSLLNVIDPDIVVLAGLFSRLWELAHDEVAAVAARRSLAAPADLNGRIVVSSDQRDASLLGAADHMMAPLLARPGSLWTAGRWPA